MFWIEMSGRAGQKGKANRKKIVMSLAAGFCMGSILILQGRRRKGREEQKEGWKAEDREGQKESWKAGDWEEQKGSRQAEEHRKGFYEKHVKRPLDILGACVLILILSPAMICIGLLVRVQLGSPVIFGQERPGFQERIFRLYKFRTMTDQRDEKGELLPDEERVTGFGKALRSTSLDELPELFNILKGDMSFVGPRPLLVRYLPYYTQEERKRHNVKPGLTGYAQIHGRNMLGWEGRFQMDCQYAQNITFFNDMKIVLGTVCKVFQKDGIVADGNYEMKDLDKERKER